MPNTTIYLDHETYIEFSNLSNEERTKIKKECVEIIKANISRTSRVGGGKVDQGRGSSDSLSNKKVVKKCK